MGQLCLILSVLVQDGYSHHSWEPLWPQKQIGLGDGQNDILWIQLIRVTFVNYLVFLSQWIQLEVFEGLLQHYDMPFLMVSDCSDLWLRPQKT